MSSVPSQQIVHATNLSLLTYQIQFRSTCDKDYLSYETERHEDNDVWEGVFIAPFRWDGEPRVSSDSARIRAKPGKKAENREVDVDINLQAWPYLPVGPFRVILQVDVEDR
jgi:hypothetical protein